MTPLPGVMFGDQRRPGLLAEERRVNSFAAAVAAKSNAT